MSATEFVLVVMNVVLISFSWRMSGLQKEIERQADLIRILTGEIYGKKD